MLTLVTTKVLYNLDFAVLIAIQVVYIVQLLRSFATIHNLQRVAESKTPVSVHQSKQRCYTLGANNIDSFLNVLLSCFTPMLRDQMHVLSLEQMLECNVSAIGPC